MDGELTSKISSIVAELAKAERERLKAAGTFIDLEELACEIGNEVTRQLMGEELAERSNSVAEDTAFCPDCGECCRQCEAAHYRQLLTSRGEVSYHEPSFYCRTCRRSFFPGSRPNGATCPSDGNAQSHPIDGLGRQ